MSEDADRLAAWLRIWSRIKALLGTPVLVVGAFVLGAAVMLVGAFGERATLGRILVDTPEVYTRERLVNDRFLQDAWLSRELERESIVPSQQVYEERRSAAARVGAGKDGARSGEGEQAPKPVAAPEPRLSSRALLLEKVDYRDVVRNLAIENQLDDRHDLNGNSLYKLKFDASVLPGANTQASAQISIRLSGPSYLSAVLDKRLRALSDLGGASEIRDWRDIYASWVENLGSRLNQTQKELKQAFHANEFAHNEYARLMTFLATNLQVRPGDVRTCRHDIVAIQGHDREPVRLGTQEHLDRKQCITDLVKSTIVEPTYVEPQVAVPGDAKQAEGNVGEYLPQPSRRPRVQRTDAAERDKVVSGILDYWLNSYFATKTVQLVLGLPVPEGSFVGRAYYDLPAFRTLVKLTFFNPYPKTSAAEAFTVRQRVAAIAALDPQTVSASKQLEDVYLATGDYWAQLYAAKPDSTPSRYEDFAAGLLPNLRWRVSRSDLDEIAHDDVELGEQDFKPVPGVPGVFVAKAEVGLLNFARMARQHVRAFTYSVTPKESSDSVSFTFSTDSSVEGEAALPGEAGQAGLQMGRAGVSRTLERRNAVVGFSSFRDDGSAEFGWLISPRHTKLDGRQHVQVQTPGQYPLSALVSLPSWWNQVRLEVTTSWVGRDGKVIDGTGETREHRVEMPTDFEPLEGILLGIEQLGPELMESRLDPVLLTACRPGAIVIPGRRLWRSTKVTLGYQTADSIAVLPNMKGIIARFGEVQNQLSITEAAQQKPDRPMEITRAVRVWTSQGSVTLPTPARIGIPMDCKRQRGE